MPDKRIIDYNEAESLSSDDYLIIDGSTNGTRKIKPNQLQVATDKTLSIENSPADAKKVGDEITGIKADLNYVFSDLDVTFDKNLTPTLLMGGIFLNRGRANYTDDRRQLEEMLHPGVRGRPCQDYS